MRVLYDGWSLVYAPLSPEALHLLAILEHLPDEVTPVVAFPQPAPGWIVNLETHIHPVPDTPFGRLRWEQFLLPSTARETEINFLHLTGAVAPMLSDRDVILSPAAFGSASGIDLDLPAAIHVLDRLRKSMTQGGMVRVKVILWPFDLPDPHLPGPLARLSPILPPGFDSELKGRVDVGGLSAVDKLEDLDLPYDFIIYHGPGDIASIERLLQAWAWAAPAIGENYPLLLLGLDSVAMTKLALLSEQYDLVGSMHFISDVTPDMLPELYRRCSAVFHPAPASPWSGPVRLALACGKPLVASESSITDAITGPAAYLAPTGDPRALGAALVTVIVEHDVADRLSAAAIRRAANWETNQYGSQMRQIYNQVFVV